MRFLAERFRSASMLTCNERLGAALSKSGSMSATTAKDLGTRNWKRQSQFWCCWRKSLTIFNQLQRAKQARHNTMMWTVTMNLLGHRRPAFVCRVHRSFSATFSQSFFEPLNLVGSPTCHCSICPRPYLPNMCHARTEGALV